MHSFLCGEGFFMRCSKYPSRITERMTEPGQLGYIGGVTCLIPQGPCHDFSFFA